MKTVLFSLVVAVLCVAFPSRADSMRCGTSLVSEGMTVAEVVQRCGEPLDKRTRYESFTETISAATRTQAAVTRTITVTVEEWTWNFGPNEFMRVTVFRDGRLTSVRTLGYGR